MDHSGRKKRFLICAAVAVCVCLFLEGVLFQYSALQTRSLQPYPLGAVSAPGQTEWTMEPLQLSDVQTIAVTFSGTIEPTRAELLISDDGHRHVRVNANETLLCPADPAYATRVMRCTPQGNLRGITIKWNREGAVLEDVLVNEPVPYRFRTKRFLLLLAVTLLIIAVRTFRLWEIVLDQKSKRHRLSYAACAGVCMLFAVYLSGQLTPYDESLFPWAQRFAYPLTMPFEEYEQVPHVLVFDALYNGQTAIRVIPDERLSQLDNVYDYTQRETAVGNYAYWWDYAYHGGKLYVYFGIAPVLLFYVPYFFLTGMLPSCVQCSLFLAILALAGGFLCVWELAKRYAPGCRLVALCLSATAAVLGSQVLMLESCPARYHISIASAQACFFFTVWTALRALGSTGHRRRVWLAASALCTALVVLSRPNVTLLAASWLTVLFLAIVFDKGYAREEKTKDAAAYLIPVAFCGVLIGAYNAARFGNPFDFGMTHLFTLWDTQKNTFAPRDLPKALWHYGFDSMTLQTRFPWFRLNNAFVNGSGNYYYVNAAGNAGAFAVPATWGNLLFVFSRKKEARDREWNALFLTSLVMTAVTACVAYGMAGICERYVCDLLPALCLTGAVCLLRSAFSPSTGAGADTGSGVPVIRLFTVVCVLTIVMAFSRCYGNEVNAVMQYAPQRYLSLVDMFSIP